MKPARIIIHAPHLSPKTRIDSPSAPRRETRAELSQGNYGPALWAELHKRALSVTSDDSEWLAKFERRVPCGSCRKHWLEMLQKTPPDWTRYFGWSVDRHNEINVKLGKPEMPLAEAFAKWSQN